MNVICNNKKCKNNVDNKCIAQEIEITYKGVCDTWEIFQKIEQMELYRSKKGNRILSEYLNGMKCD